MADEFERFLGESLSPAARLPDRSFVASVQARIVLEERLDRQRQQLVAGFLSQLAALAAIAAGFVVLSRLPVALELASESPQIFLAGLLLAFGCVVALFSTSGQLRPFAGR